MQRFRTATHWGVYEVEVQDGLIAGVYSISEDPVPASAMYTLKDAASHSSRIDQPYVRKGWLETPEGRAVERRGDDQFVAVGWDEALDLAAGELKRVIEVHGNTSIFGGSYGWASAGRCSWCPCSARARCCSTRPAARRCSVSSSKGIRKDSTFLGWQ